MYKKTSFFIVGLIGFSFAFSFAAKTQDDILRKIDRTLQKARSDWESPGLAVAIVKDDSLVFAKGYGVRELGKPQKVDKNTLFAVGSQTKSFTAAALAMLVDERKLKWDDPVTNYLPQFALSDPWITKKLTIRDCLTHRSGLEPLIMPWILTNFTRDEYLRRYRHARSTHGFRTTFSYNNTMYLLAGQIIPAVTGKTWDEFVKERIFNPLGMNTSNTSTKDFTREANRASPHEIIDGKLQPTPWRNVDNIGPAGSINSSVTEMAQWLRLQLGNGTLGGKHLIKAKTMKEMHSPQQIISSLQSWSTDPRISFNVLPLLKSRFMTYGFGWFIQDYRDHLLIHHGGDVDGMRCQTGMIPELNLGVVIFSNLHPGTLVEALMFSIFDVFIGGEARDWSSEVLTMVKEYEQKKVHSARRKPSPSIARSSPARSLEEYTGFYDNDLYGKAEVTCKEGQLIINLGQIEAPLIPIRANSFRISEPIMYIGQIPVSFIPNKEGTIHLLKLLGIIDYKRSLSGRNDSNYEEWNKN